MGAITSNRKQADDYFNSNYKSESLDPNSRISKRQKIVHSMNQTPVPPVYSAACRIYSYPQPLQRIRREVHAPCRTSRFGFAASLPSEVCHRQIDTYAMRNILSSNYEKAKKLGFSALRILNKEKHVINAEENTVKESYEDSSIQVIDIVDDDCEVQSLYSDYLSKDDHGIVDDSIETETYSVVTFRQSSSSTRSDIRNSKVDNSMKMLDSLSLKQEPPHKRMYKDSVNRRNCILSSLSFKIKFNESCRGIFGLFGQSKKSDEDLVEVPFVPLTKEDEVEVARALSKSNRRKVLVTHESSNVQITGEILQCLRPGAWLNDEVINLYLELLKEREKKEPKKFLKCHFFNTFFYKKLYGRNGYDYKSVRRWTTGRKLGYSLLDCDKIFVPIHKEVHWCLAVINKKDEKFQYLDSLRGRDRQVMKVLANYFVDEVKDKNGEDIDISSWEQEFVEDLPHQANGFDCGMFMIKYIDFYSRDVGLCFNQDHMPYFRKRTAKEILRLKAD